MKVFEAVKTGARIVTNAGLTFIGNMMEKAGFLKKCNELQVAVNHPGNRIRCGDILGSAIGLLCMGNSAYESCHEFDNDKEFYQEALGIERIPSAERSGSGRRGKQRLWTAQRNPGNEQSTITTGEG